MDTEVQPNPPHENGSKIEETPSDPPDDDAAAKEKDGTKTPPKASVPRETRSRSGTPQKKKDKKNDDNLKTDTKKIREKTPPSAETTTNGPKTTPKSLVVTRETRSRSRTPQKKKDKKTDDSPKTNAKTPDESVNGHEEKVTRSSERKKNKESSKAVEEIEEKDDKTTKESKSSPRKPKAQDQTSDAATVKPTEIVESELSPKKVDPSKPEGEGIEMDPLILAMDEPDPELQFDENSDMDSGKGSPNQARCKTRRSHTRNIPTPKTPKSATDSESEKNSVAPTPTPENLNDTNDSLNIEDISTRAEAGGDSTRLDYFSNNTSVITEDSSYLNYSRERSLGETLRSLSPRKTIRPLNDSYRQRAFRNNLNKSDLNVPYPEQDSVDRISGLKRKRSVTPEERKKFKYEGTSFSSYLSSPLSNFRSRFASDFSSSTPKLTGYKDSSKDIHEEVAYSEVVSEDSEKKNWCAIM